MLAIRQFKTLLGRMPAVAHVASRVKAGEQERTAKRGRERVEEQARRRGVSVMSDSRKVEALRTRLAARALKHAWPRKKGGLHIFLAFRLFDWEEVLPHAFKPFGEVTVFEWAGQGFDHDAVNWWERRPDMNRAMLAAFRAANSRKPVDAVVGALSGHNTAPATLAEMAAAGAAIFNFSYDDKLDSDELLPDGTARGPIALAAQVDLNLSSDPGAALKYALRGGLSHFHPEAADPVIHRPYDVDLDYDVTFVGARYGFRPMFISKLQAMGVSVRAYGRNWPAGSLPTDGMVEMYSRSRINLGFSGIGHSRRLMCLKGRDFEVPMSGGLYLTQHNPDLERVFDVGREIVTYTDEADCAAKVRMLLNDPERAAAIRVAGRVRCLRDHTYEARWTKVFQLAGIL